MTKAQLVKEMREGFGITVKEAEERIAHVDEIMELLAKGEVGEKTKVGSYLTVEKVHKEAKKGVMKTGEGERHYHTPAHDELVIKRTTKAKSI